MTRTGKSNTMKIMAAAVHQHDEKDVGQLIFDPSGEYSSINDQDEVALGELEYDDIEHYKYNATEEDDAKSFNPNLFVKENIDEAVSAIVDQVRKNRDDISGEYQKLRNISINTDKDDFKDENNGYGKYRQNIREMGAVHALMIRGDDDMEVNDNHWWNIEISDSIIGQVLGYERDDNKQELDRERSDSWIESKQFKIVPAKDDNTIANIESKKDNEFLGCWKPGKISIKGSEDLLESFYIALGRNTDKLKDKYMTDDFEVLLKMITADTSNIKGYGYLTGISKSHNKNSEGKKLTEIYSLLEDGHMVILDMSNGHEDILSKYARNYTDKIVGRSMAKFVDQDDQAPDIQIYLEEAHRYFSEDEFQENDDSPYVRVAKEGGKFNIGITYATQEISSVDDRVLANTANWFVTHLNSDSEIRELSDYYDFGIFANKVKQVEKKGFSRVRMMDDTFTAPLQIDLFNRDWVEENISEGVLPEE